MVYTIPYFEGMRRHIPVQGNAVKSMVSEDSEGKY